MNPFWYLIIGIGICIFGYKQIKRIKNNKNNETKVINYLNNKEKNRQETNRQMYMQTKEQKNKGNGTIIEEDII